MKGVYMKSEAEILDKIKEYEEKLDYYQDNYCECGCQNDSIDYYRDKINTLKWVLGSNN